MFGAIKNRLRNIIALDTDKVLREIFSNTGLQRDIIDLNTQDQLYDKGIDSKGTSLGQYSPATIQGTKNFKGKIELGLRYDHITLYNSGEFYNSWKFKNKATEFLFTANAKKTSMENAYDQGAHGNVFKLSKKQKVTNVDLTLEYGKDIIGLTNENIAKVRVWVKPDVVKKIRREVFK